MPEGKSKLPDLDEQSAYKNQILGTETDGTVKRIHVNEDGDLIVEVENIVDSFGRQSFNTIFPFSKDMQVQIEGTFVYGVRTDEVKDLSANGGSVGFSQGSLLQLTTGADPNGVGAIETKNVIIYKAGRDAVCMMTIMFDTPQVDSFQRGGAFNGENGFGFGYKDTDFHIFKKNEGIYEDEIIWSDFNGGGEFAQSPTKDGELITFYFSAGEFTLNPQTLNIYFIQYGYLGVAPIYYSMYMGRELGWRMLHVIDPVASQSYTDTHIDSPYLPIKGEVINVGNTTPLTVYSGSVMAGTISKGDPLDVSPATREFNVDSGIQSVSSVTNEPIIIFHNKATFFGRDNKIADLLAYVTGSSDGNKSVNFKMYGLAVPPTGAIWQDVDTVNSNLEYSLVGTIDLTDATLLFQRDISKINDFFEDVLKYGLLLFPDGYATLTVTTPSLSDVTAGIRESERY